METLKKQAAKLLGEQKKYRRWLAVFLCLAIAVTAGTTAALKMNGQALSHEKKVLACGMEVHVHTAECYESGIITGESAINGEQPICGYADYVVHAHDASCYDEGGDLVCQIPEVKPHVHTESCFEKQMILICGEEEAELHQHTDACRELICGQEEAETVQVHQHTEECKALICETEETEGHQHTDACRAVTQGDLICENTEEGHEHTAECYEQVETIVCGQEETEGHVHTDECYNMQACGLEENAEGHTHTEECYGSYICGQEETEGHTHTDACYQVKEVTICGQLELHTHITGAEEGSCYDAQGNLICGIPELKEHVHGEECFEIIEVKDEEETQLVQKVYEDAEIRVTAEYRKDAGIPEEAELVAERMEADAQEPAGTEGDTDAQEADEDIAAEEVTYRLKFLVDGTEIEPESTVSFVVHGLDGEGNDTGELVTLVYKAGDELDTMTVTLLRECIASSDIEGSGNEDAEAQPYRKVYEDAEIRVSAEYGEEANIPETVEFIAERIDAEEQTADENIAGEDGIQEPVEEEVSYYRLRFLVDGEETEPEGTVKFTAQALDEEGNEAGEPAELIYNAGDGLDTMVITLTREITIEVQHEFRQTAEVGNVRVIAEYDSEAKIPEEAQLQAALITEDGAPDSYGEFKAMYLEQAGENAVMDMLLEIGFYVGDEKVAAQAPVSIKVQIADSSYEAGEKVNVFCIAETGVEGEKAAVAAEEDGSRSISFKADGLSTYMIGREAVSLRKECRNEALNIIVVAEYGPEAEIPANAELKAEEITPESDPEHYAQREAEYLEQAGEGAVMDMLLNIGFYVDGVEVEPKAPVSITIQMLDGQYEDGEQMNVVHFGDEATEKLDASDIRTDEEGNKVTSFETSSFSNYALGRNGENGLNLEDGSSYQIYCENNGEKYALYHDEDNSVKAVKVTLSAQGSIVVPNGYTEEGFIWEYENNGYEATLKYDSGGLTYYLVDAVYDAYGPQIKWQMTTYAFRTVQFTESNGAIKILGVVANNYLNCSNGQIVAGANNGGTDFENATAWTFVDLFPPEVGEYKINYYKNENSVTFFQDPVPEAERGTLLGFKRVDSEESPDGKTVIRIPLTGMVRNVNIGSLDDYVKDGNTYKFYGWSLDSNSNYMPDINHLIYCGDPTVTINGHTVPTYVSDGVITVDVTNIAENKEINLYAMWAAPSNVGGSTGVKYYGTGNKELSEPKKDMYGVDAEKKDLGINGGEGARLGRGVMFFVRLDGQIPNEPGSPEDTSEGGILNRANYTEYVFAKIPESDEIVRQPLKYWMHIYGVQNGDAVGDNLAYKPDDEDLLKRIKEKNGSIKVAGQIVDFSEMTVEEFRRDYYVAWYVCKDGRENDCWHIDGVLMKKTDQWNLVYADNGKTGGTVIPGIQYAFRGQDGSLATIHNSLVASGDNLLQSDIPLEKTGYTFVGWNTDPNGKGTSFTAGTYTSDNGTADTDFTDNNTITVEVINKGTENEKAEVYKNGEKVEGLYATKNANGVYEVILYPQWAKGTNLLKVTKTDLNGVKLNGAKFKLYECNMVDGHLVTGSELTAEGGIATSGEGMLTIQNLKNDTYYCLEESYAPNGYEQRNVIYFMVEVSEDNNKVMEIHIKDESGEDVAERDKPTWLTATYQPKDASGTGGLASINFTIADEAILQEVSFKKTKEDGETALKGAEFNLYKEVAGENGALTYELTGTSGASGDDGTFSFTCKDKEGNATQIEKLSYGKYKLEETKAPDGYSKVTVYFEINDPDDPENPDTNKPESYRNGMVVTKVEVDGKELVGFDSTKYSVTAQSFSTTSDDNVSATRYKYTLTVANVPGKQTVALKKLGDDGENLVLKDAQFNLYKDNKKKELVKGDIKSGDDGIAELGELDCGDYYLFEEEAPDGYIKPTEPIKIVVATGNVTAARGSTIVNVWKETVKGQEMQVLQIYNTKGIVLPETGGPGTTMYTLGGFAVIAASLMYGLSMRRKKEKGGCH